MNNSALGNFSYDLSRVVRDCSLGRGRR